MKLGITMLKNNFQVLFLLLVYCMVCISNACQSRMTENRSTMNITQKEKYDALIKMLEDESAELTPMLRSKVYSEIVSQSDSIVPLLVSSVQDDTVKHYLTLMAISEIDIKALSKIPTETRLKIYSDALQKGGPHNDWGLAGEHLSGASLDLVRIGEKSIPYLTDLLDDTTAAGIWGSEEATINKQYQNRVCDFAYYLILQIIKRNEPYLKPPKLRDASIDSLKKFLKKSS